MPMHDASPSSPCQPSPPANPDHQPPAHQPTLTTSPAHQPSPPAQPTSPARQPSPPAQPANPARQPSPPAQPASPARQPRQPYSASQNPASGVLVCLRPDRPAAQASGPGLHLSSEARRGTARHGALCPSLSYPRTRLAHRLRISWELRESEASAWACLNGNGMCSNSGQGPKPPSPWTQRLRDLAGVASPSGTLK